MTQRARAESAGLSAQRPKFYIGLMSGTSLDGVDGVLADVFGEIPSSVVSLSTSFAPELRAELLALNSPCEDELHRAAQAGNALTRVYAGVVDRLLQAAGIDKSDVTAIGAHGQTVRHCPPGFVRPEQVWPSATAQRLPASAYTIQLQNPALLAELTGIDVVADFRSRDIAAGGQGAPLVPAFHRAVFGGGGDDLAVVNIGGISNVSLIKATDQAPLGFDTGPGNVLMDLWVGRHRGEPYDREGAWAASGRVHYPLLDAMFADPYFALKPPKSTGRDAFHAAWLDGILAAFPGVPPHDVQATLAELTARCIRSAVALYAPDTRRVWVCGGGALNSHLMRRLQILLPSAEVDSTLAHGMDPMQVEAMAFAWLAQQCIERRPGNLPSATGALGERVLGAIYPGQ